MKLSTWRPSFQTWLRRFIGVDDWVWHTDEIPEDYTTAIAHLPPLRDVDYRLEAPDVRATAVQDFFIVKRFPRQLSYAEMPIADMEAKYAEVAARVLLAAPANVAAGLQRIDHLSANSPLIVGEIGELSNLGTTQGTDWLIRLAWSFEIEFIWEPEQEASFRVTELTLNLWRSHLGDFDDNVLDFTFKKNFPQP